MSGMKPSCEELEKRISELEAELEKRGRTEQELRETNERMRAIFEHSPAGIALTTLEGKVISINQAITDKIGYTLEELQKRNAAEFYQSPRDREELLEKVRRDGFVRNHEVSLRAKDGSTFIGLVNMILVKARKDMYLLTMIEDITGLRLSLETLQASEERFRYILKYNPSAIAVLDTGLRFIMVSDVFLTEYAINGKEIIGLHHDEIFPETPQRMKEVYQRVLAGAVERMEEDQFLRLDGSVVYNRWECRPWYERAGLIGGIIFYSEVTTGRKLAEEALRERQELTQTLLDNLTSGVVVKDFQDRYLLVNRKAAEVIGKSSEEIIGKTPFDLYPREIAENIHRDDMQTIESGKVVVTEERLRLDDDRIYFTTKVPIFARDGSPKGLCGLFTDITERKLAEKALRESEAHLQAIFNNAAIGIALTDPEGHLVQVNRQLVEMLGYDSKEELLSKSTLDITHPEDREACRKVMLEMVSGAIDSFRMEKRYLKRDGSHIWVDISVTEICNQDGSILALVGVVFDISERMRNEQALRESEARLQAIFNNAEVGIALSDPSGRLVQVNRHFLEMLGYESQEEVIFQTPLELTHPEDREASRRLLQQMASGTIDTFRVEKRYLRRDGRYFWGDISVTAIRNPDRSIKAQVGVIVDISERKSNEQALRESEENFRALAENVTDIILRMDGNLRCLYANPAITRFTGLPPGHYVGRTVRDIGLPEKNVQLWEKQLRKVLELGEPVESIYELELDAEKLIFDWRLIPEFDSTGRLATLLSTSRDITAIRQLEEERAKLSKLESMGVLAGGIAHDFNNILTAVLGNISLVRMLSAEEKIVDYLVEAEKAALRAKDLTRQLLTFSKGGQPVKRICAIGPLLKDSADFAIRGSNVKCEYIIPADLWPAEVDEGQISQVINNLVINAEQAMPDGGMLRVKAENVTLKGAQAPGMEEGPFVQITIQDSGIGIPGELLSKIFDPYFTTKQTGSGLGLTTSHSIVRKHGGSIVVESTLGVGTIFHIHLPASPMKLAKTVKLGPETSGPAARILVMDDEPVVLEVAAKMLSHIGHQVAVAEEGGMAVEMYRNAGNSGRPFDVVILDLTIKGGMGGREALEKMIEINPGVKAIVSSGYSNDPVLSDFKKFGFRGMVAKPYRMEDLKQILSRVIRE